MMLVAEITAAIDAAGTTKTLLFATRDWTTRPTDTPPNEPMRGKLIEAGNYSRSIGIGKGFAGAAQSAYGTAAVQVAAGQLDALLGYGYGWRSFVLRGADVGAYDKPPAYPSGWTTLQVCTVDDKPPQASATRLIWTLRDNLTLLDKPLCATYAGTGGLEGPASLAGQPKPRVYGQAARMEPTLVDFGAQIYMLSDRPYTQPRHAYDRAVAYTPIGSGVNDAATLAALQALTLGTSEYARCSDLSLVRLGSAPSGRMTVDAIRHDPTYSTVFGRPRIGEVLGDVATDAGLTGAQLDPALSALESAGGPVHGLYVRDLTTTYQQALGRLAASRGAWVGCNRLGVLTGGILAAPSGSPVWTFRPGNTLDVQLVAGPYPVPIKSAAVRGGHNWTPMTLQETGTSLSTADREALSRSHLYIETATGTAATKHLNAPPETFDTLSGSVSTVGPALPGSTVGMTPASLLAMFGVERLTALVTVGLDRIGLALLAAVDLGAVVLLQWPRWGLDAGRLMLVLALQSVNLARKRATFMVWG